MKEEQKAEFSKAVAESIDLIVDKSSEDSQHPVANVSVTILMDDNHNDFYDPVDACSLQDTVVCPDNMPLETEAVEAVLLLAASQYKAMNMKDMGPSGGEFVH